MASRLQQIGGTREISDENFCDGLGSEPTLTVANGFANLVGLREDLIDPNLAQQTITLLQVSAQIGWLAVEI
jgi:hypothetical protein